MDKLEVLFFDVLGTVVDWRGSVTDEVRLFLQERNADMVDPIEFADAWVRKYDAVVNQVRDGSRAFALLDVLNRENLVATMKEFELDPDKCSEHDICQLNFAWHRLKPWQDSVQAVCLLKQAYIVAPLSDGNTRLLVNMAKHTGLLWDTVVGSDISRAYKPSLDVYRKACELLDVAPDRAMLVAAHDYDLAAAKACGLRTAFVDRQQAQAPVNVEADGQGESWDYNAKSLIELATVLLEAD